MVASAVGVPTPTIACSTPQACLSTCWMDGSSFSAAASSGVDATIGVGMTVALVISPSAAPSPLDDRKAGRYASTPPVSDTIRTGPTAPKLVAAMTWDTVSPQPTPRLPPGRRWVAMNWAPPRPSRAFSADREPSPEA
jgi:hypothetical protein